MKPLSAIIRILKETQIETQIGFYFNIESHLDGYILLD